MGGLRAVALPKCREPAGHRVSTGGPSPWERRHPQLCRSQCFLLHCRKRKCGNGSSTVSQQASTWHPSGPSCPARLVQRHHPSIIVAGLDVVPALPPAAVMVPSALSRPAAGHGPAVVPSTTAPSEARQERTSAFPGLPPSCRHVSPGKCLG